MCVPVSAHVGVFSLSLQLHFDPCPLVSLHGEADLNGQNLWYPLAAVLYLGLVNGKYQQERGSRVTSEYISPGSLSARAPQSGCVLC